MRVGPHARSREHRETRGLRTRLLLLVVATVASGLAACHQGAAHSGQLATTIADLETVASTVSDLAASAQWERAANRTAVLRETTARIEATEGRQLPDLERAITQLDQAIEDHDAKRSRRGANEVMRQAVLLGSSRLGSESVAFLMLDVEARRVLIEADDDPDAAAAAAARIAELWETLRPEVDRRGQQGLASRCERHVRALEAGPADARREEAEALLRSLENLREVVSQARG